jgi:tRNA threonylcarbamoyladenosine biosynthesis protein TsaB
MSLILNIESSTTNCSVSIAKNGVCIALQEVNEGFSHSENLIVFVDNLLKDTETNVKDLNAIAVSAGPGSYTGLRIGVSSAKGLCFGLDTPLIAIDSLSIMTKQVLQTSEINSGDLLIPMFDARRMEIYTAVFDTNLKYIEPISAKIIIETSFIEYDNGNKVYYFGDGSNKCKEYFKRFKNFCHIDNLYPSSKYMSELSYLKFLDKKFEDVAYFEPNYLKDFYTKAKPID